MGEEVPFEIKSLPKNLLSKGLFTKYKALRNIVLFLGNTGKGKSTITEILRGNQELRAEGKNGDYIMEDGSGRISARGKTILSQTTFPDPIWYEGLPKNTCYLDCPGFEDTRSSAMDILCTIYTTEAIKHCHSVKIVLVANYDDVKEGGDRKAFIALVKMLSEFAQNLDKFKNSIALFVTKVPNLTMDDEDGHIYFIPDEKMKENVTSFLLNLKKFVLSKENDVKEHKVTYNNAFNLINMIMPKAGDIYDTSRIGMIRCPKKKGLIHQMPQFQAAKASLHDIIHKKLKFANLGSSDFKCTISPDSKVYLEKVVQSTIEEASLVVQLVISEIEKSYEHIEEVFSDIESLYTEFRRLSDVWNNSFQQIENQKYITKFLEYFLENVASLVVGALTDQSDQFKKGLDDLNQMTRLMHILEKVSNKEYNISTQQLLKIFNDVKTRIQQTRTWYAALSNVAEISESYEVQRKLTSAARSTYFDKLERWAFTKEATLIPGKAVQEALFEVCKTNVKYNLDFMVSPIKLKHLLNLSQQAFEEVTVVSDQKNCRAQGHFVALSAVMPKIGEAKQLDILATYKLFIDCDIDAVGKELKILMIAPICEVIGDSRKVNLNGAEGLSYDYPAALVEMARTGPDGKPGGAGGHGGFFIGIGHKMINGGNLRISADGGKGGRGQDGAKGGSGKGGVDAELQECEWKLIKKTLCAKYLLRGTDGLPGNNGGNGGKGGAAGKAGFVCFHGLNNDNIPYVSAKHGDIGENGKGGPGGVGGQHGKHALFTLAFAERLLSFEKFRKCKNYHCRGKSWDGDAGSDGTAEWDGNGNISTTQLPSIFSIDLKPIIENYEALYLKKTKNVPRYPNHSSFLKTLSDHSIQEKCKDIRLQSQYFEKIK